MFCVIDHCDQADERRRIHSERYFAYILCINEEGDTLPRTRDGGVDFSISGCQLLDGRLQRMEDRVEALGGSVQFDGSTLGGSIPLGVPV